MATTTSSATPWDRAHAKSCWARRSNSTDVAAIAYRGMDGVYEVGLPAWMEARSPPPRAPSKWQFGHLVARLRPWPDGWFWQRGIYTKDGRWLSPDAPQAQARRTVEYYGTDYAAPETEADKKKRAADYLNRFREMLNRRADAKRR